MTDLSATTYGQPAYSPNTNQGAMTDVSGVTDARTVISDMLNSWGLGALSDQAWSSLTQGASLDQVIFDIRNSPTYKQSIFGQTNTARAAAGLPAMSEAQIASYKDTAEQLMRASGLPQGFYSSDQELASLMGADVSTAELQTRIASGYEAAANATPDVKQALTQMYGLDAGHLAAFFLDPTKAEPLIMQTFKAAQISGTAAQTGYGFLNAPTAEGLVQAGVTAAQAQTGFADLGKQSQLFGALPGSQEAVIGEQQQLGAEFLGQSDAQKAIAARAAARVATFQEGGQFAATSGKGITGTGVARGA